ANCVVTGLTANTTYYYRVRGTNTSTNSNTITVATKAGTVAASHFVTKSSGNISEITTWQSSTNNTGWINATAAPTADAKSIRVLNGHELTVDENSEVAEIIVRAGGKLTVPVGKSLELSGKIYLESNETDGTATFVNNGTATITGDAVVKQYLSAGRNWYFSSPISNATSAVFKETEENQLWERNVAGNSWTEITATDVDLTPLKGYIGKVAANGVVTFNGTLNNANIPALTLTKSNATNGKFHLVGNPYPSYLDWQAVAVANPNLTGSMWFRTKTAVSEQVPTSVYTFSTVLYTTEAGLQIVNGNANTTVTPKIPPMQAFWVRIKDGVETANFTVNNDMRYHADETGNKFKAPAVKNQTLRLEVSNGVHRDEALLYFNDNASDNFDRFDSPKMFNNIATVPEIYTQSGLEKLVINGMNSYNYTTEIPLGFNAGQTNSYSIRATDVQNFDADTRVVLFDTDTETEFDLTAGEAYNFSSDAVNSDNRFSIRFKSASGTTLIDDVNKGAVLVSALQGRLSVQLNTILSDNAKVTVYNAMGQSIYNQPLHNAVTQLSQIFEPGVYVLKVENGEKSLVAKSLIY
ncbi:MAG TPA: T9SS type A sorting domain-containing protein, partial [Bacteroidales bacterium]|nr:T9SS type A sorting domain-containing protein [Bacteroidales bacterium]